MDRNNIICNIVWNNKTQDSLKFYLQFHYDQKIRVIALCFTSHMRLETLSSTATLALRHADFHQIVPKEPLYACYGDHWEFSVLSFYTTEASHIPLRLGDGPTGAYIIYEEDGKEHFADITVDFRFTHPELPITYSKAITALSKNTPILAENSQQQAEDEIFLPNPATIIWSSSTKKAQCLSLQSAPSIAKQAYCSAFDLTGSLYGEAKAKVISDNDDKKSYLNCIIDETLPAEYYEIHTLNDDLSMELKASDYAGFFYGFITLYQYLLNQPSKSIHQIKDEPRFSFRGCHLDVARTFQPLEQIQQFLQKMAWLKLNVLHLHFCDDEAWRIQINAYPELTEIGAFRGHDHLIKPTLGSSWKKNGGFYTQSELKSLVQYAQKLNISIIPEFDMPGHHHAALQSLPWLKEDEKQPDIFSIQGFNRNCLSPALSQTYEFIKAVVAELVDIFPHPYFHIGGDEVPHGSWMHSSCCKELSKQQGFSFTTANLQSYLLRKTQDILHEYDRFSCAWQEAADGLGLDQNKNAYLTVWKDIAHASKLLEQGYNIVISPGSHYYLDMAQDDNIASPGLSWAGHSDVTKTYMFEPLPQELKAYEKQILGIQACIWGENMRNENIFNQMIFPRLYAVAEAAWSKPKRRNIQNFLQRAAKISL